MTFLTPLLAGVVAAIAVPTLIILYFLKLRRRDVEVSSTLLWKKAIQDMQANAPFQRLRNNILLILQLLALLLALLSLASPEVSGLGGGGEKHVIMIDRSASMSTVDAAATGQSGPEGETPPTRENAGNISGTARLDEAKRRALELVDKLPEGGWLRGEPDQAMVIAFDTVAVPLQPMTRSKEELRRAIRAVEPSEAPSSIEDAMRLAKAQAPRRTFTSTDQKGNTQLFELGETMRLGTIHVFSDGRIPDAASVASGVDDTVIYHAVGRTMTSNVGIVDLAAQRSITQEGRLSVLAGVQSTFRESVRVDVQLVVDGRVRGQETITLPAATPRTAAATAAAGKGAVSTGEPSAVNPVRQEVAFTLDETQGLVVTVRLRPVGAERLDACAEDDSAFLVVPPAKRLSVALVTPGNAALQDALESMTLAKLDLFSPSQAAGMLGSAKRAEYDVIVLDRWTPSGGGAGVEGAAPPGRYLVVGASLPPPLGVRFGESEQQAAMIDWRRSHPALQNAPLENVQLANPLRTKVDEDKPVAVLAESTTGPVIVEGSTASVRALTVTFNVLESTWPFDLSFPVFVSAAVRHLGDEAVRVGAGPGGGSGGGRGDGRLRPGGTLSEPVPSAATDIRLTLPDGERQPLNPGADGRVVYGPLRRSGVYTLSWIGPALGSDVASGDGRSRRAIAVNLLDADESDVGTATTLPLANQVVGASRMASAVIQSLWPIALLVFLALLLLEWFVYHRRVAI